MMANMVDLQPAYVLHRRPYRDTSFLVDVLTREYGKVTVVARGLRKAGKRQNSSHLLQPLIPLLISWQGRSSLKRLTSVEPQGYFVPLEGDRLYVAMYMNELLVYLLRENDSFEEVYQRYQTAVVALSDPEEAIEPYLRSFEFTLLEAMGYGIDFLHEADSHEPIEAHRQYYYQTDKGFLPHTDKARGIAMSGEIILAIAEGSYHIKEVALAAKYLSRCALAPHLTDKELKSRELFLRKPQY